MNHYYYYLLNFLEIKYSQNIFQKLLINIIIWKMKNNHFILFFKID